MILLLILNIHNINHTFIKINIFLLGITFFSVTILDIL